MRRQSGLVARARIASIEHSIVRVRGCNVILDEELAALYGTTTKRLNEQVRRNAQRFPTDFMFRLTRQEFEHLRSQIATSSAAVHGGRRHLPCAFTEHGAIMAANVVNTPSAVRMSVVVVRAFVKLRQILQSQADLARRLDALEAKYEGQFGVVFEAIRELMTPRSLSRKRIGFRNGGAHL